MALPRDRWRGGTTPRYKNECNNVIVSSIQRLGIRDGAAVILDGPECRTRDALVAGGFPSDNIRIPNFTDSFPVIKSQHPHAYPLTLNHFLSVAKGHGSISVAYFDYCGTWQGRHGDPFRPKDDIELLFSRRLMAQKGVLAMTVSRRGSIGEGRFINMVDAHITEVARKNEYFISKLPGGFGYGPNNMYFTIYLVERFKTIRQEKTPLPIDWVRVGRIPSHPEERKKPKGRYRSKLRRILDNMPVGGKKLLPVKGDFEDAQRAVTASLAAQSCTLKRKYLCRPAESMNAVILERHQ